MLLEGTLQQFPLSDLVNMIIYSSVTGVLEVVEGEQVGRLYSRDGRLYHAVVDAQNGTEAFNWLYAQSGASFRFLAGETSDQETLWQDPWQLLTEAEEQLQLWMRVRAYIPSLQCVPALRAAKREGRVQVSDTGWATLGWIDGVRSIEDIATEMQQASMEVAESLIPLIQQGAVVIQPPRPHAPQTAEPTVGERLAARGRSVDVAQHAEKEPIWRRLRSRQE